MKPSVGDVLLSVVLSLYLSIERDNIESNSQEEDDVSFRWQRL